MSRYPSPARNRPPRLAWLAIALGAAIGFAAGAASAAAEAVANADGAAATAKLPAPASAAAPSSNETAESAIASAPLYFPADPNIAFGGAEGEFLGAFPADGYDLPLEGMMPGGPFAGGVFAGPPGKPFRLVGGVDLVLVQPFFDNNEGLVVVASDGVSTRTVSGHELDWGVEFSPRLWVKSEWGDRGGVRLAWWRFDHSAGRVSASAPANGLGGVFTPDRFPTIDISATAPGESLSAQSWLDIWALDLEGVQDARLGRWRLVASGGIRYAEIDQRYLACLQSGGALAGEIDFRRHVDGVGPTASLLAERPLPLAFTLFTDARFALLYGDNSTTLQAGENLNLANPFRTTANFTSDDLLFVAESRLGVLWGPQNFRTWYPFVGVALEGQIWDQGGSATTDDGNLGFFGLNLMLGASW